VLYLKHPTTYLKIYKKNGKAMLVQAWSGPEVSERLRSPDFKTVET